MQGSHAEIKIPIRPARGCQTIPNTLRSPSRPSCVLWKECRQEELPFIVIFWERRCDSEVCNKKTELKEEEQTGEGVNDK